MYRVVSDKVKNRLYLTLGRLTPEEARAAAIAVGKEAFRMKPGFTLVTDLREYVPMDQQTALQIRKGQKALVKAGISIAVRVATSPIALLQFDRRGRDQGLHAESVDTLEEAERFLDEYEAARASAPPEEENSP